MQAFSVQSDNIVLNRITVDNSDGDDNGGHNTDAFDVGESTGVTIRDAVVKNQDDCLAINSGSVCTPIVSFIFLKKDFYRTQDSSY